MAMMALAGWVLGCVETQDTGTPAFTTTATTTTGTPPTTGSSTSGTRNDGSVEGVSAYLADRVPTVVVVEWTAAEAGLAWVEYGEGEAFDRSTPVREVEPGPQRDLLLGLPQDTDISFRVVLTSDSGRSLTEDHLLRTGVLEIDGPQFAAPSGTPEAASTPWVLASESDGASTAFVIDRSGRVVWGVERDRSRAAGMVRALPDGSGILLLEGDKWREKDNGQLVWIDWEGNELQVVPVSYAHHSFDFLPDGTIVVLAADLRDLDPYGTVAGDRLVELAPDGTQSVVWSSWDDITPVYEDEWVGVFYGDAMDWTHGNGVHYVAERDAYLFSSLHLGQVMEIDRATGHVLYRYGGADGYPPTDPDAAWDDQHGPTWTPQGTLMFAGNKGLETRAFEFEVDHAAGELVPVMVYGEGLGIYANSGGLAQRQEDGGTWVQFGSAGVFHELGSDGHPVWELASDPVANVTSAFPLASFYGAE